MSIDFDDDSVKKKEIIWPQAIQSLHLNTNLSSVVTNDYLCFEFPNCSESDTSRVSSKNIATGAFSLFPEAVRCLTKYVGSPAKKALEVFEALGHSLFDFYMPHAIKRR